MQQKHDKIIELKNLDKSFGGVHAINNLSFNIYKGEILGLIGPNGCGKSTLVNIISGFYIQDKGEILYYPENDSSISLKEQQVYERARMGIARTFQTPKPFSDMTVFENIFTVALLYNKTFREAKEAAEEIIDFIGFSKLASEKCTKLPIEKRKLLDMARALAIRPKIMMLDECLAGLTPGEMEESLEMVKKINKRGVTILFIEHVMAAVTKLCSRVIVMEEGRYMVEGEPMEVMKKPEVIKAYLGEDYKNVYA